MATKTAPTEIKFYVYSLAYPPERGGAIFYIGKGQGKRMSYHEYLARSGNEQPRAVIIREIWENGGKVVKTKLFETVDEQAALTEELRLIDLYGLDNLAGGAGGKPRIRKEAEVEPHSVGFWRDQWEIIVSLANQEASSVSVWIRRLVDAEIARRQEPTTKDDHAKKD